PKTERLEALDIMAKIKLVSLDISEFANVQTTLKKIKPNLIFNLAAQSFVHDSFSHPKITSTVNFDSVINILEAIKLEGLDCSLYQASTSEMYGVTSAKLLDESSKFNPSSPYAVAKMAAHFMIKTYREAYGMRCCSGILFNHESELRGKEFVTRKITSQLAEVKIGMRDCLLLGNMDSQRDWGYAPEYVEAMIAMLTCPKVDDYVVATNTLSSVRLFLEFAAREIGFKPVFDGELSEEVCIDENTGRVIAKVDPEFFRPLDVSYLRGDFNRISSALGWSPKVFWEEISSRMAYHDLKMLT
ncbi:MAG: GDP-mannose 4,6-dehydratase, partial [Paracoccaceae bacterium]